MDDFRLKVFIAAARTLSFTRAAEQLYISQPAVSKPQTINPAVSIVLILSEVLVVG